MPTLLDTLTPLTLGGTEEQGDPMVSGLLSGIRRLLSQPVLPNDPMSRAGSILAGFGAGVQGQPNPVIEQARKLQADELTKTLGLAQLMHSLQTEKRLQSSARFNQAKDYFSIRTEMLKQRKSLAEEFPEKPEIMERYLMEQSELAGMPLAKEGAVKLAGDKAARGSYEKYLADNVLFALSGSPNPPGIPDLLSPQVRQDILLNPVKRNAWLQKTHPKLAAVTDPSVGAEKTFTEQAKRRFELAEALTKSEALDVLTRAKKGETVPLTAAHAFASGIKDADTLGFLMNMLAAEGTALSPGQAEMAKAHRDQAFSKGLPAEAQLAVATMGLPPGDPRKKPLQDILAKMSEPFQRNAIVAAASEIAQIQQKRKLGLPRLPEDDMKLVAWEEYLRSTKGEVFMVLRKAFEELPDADAPPFTGAELADPGNQQLQAWAKAHGTRDKALAALRTDPSVSASAMFRYRRAISTEFPPTPLIPGLPNLPTPGR